MSDAYDYYQDNEDYGDYEQMSPRAKKRLGKKKFYVCDEHGNCVKIAWNKFPAGAAHKGVTEGLTKILILDPTKNGGQGKWYGYTGMKVQLRPRDLTEHQKMYGMKYKTKVYRHELPAAAHVAGRNRYAQAAGAPDWGEEEEFAEYY